MHHSDRGVQYAARDYVTLLREHGISPSMNRAGMPTDNAACERFIGTLKREEIYLRDYDDILDARQSIGHFLDVVYNTKRRHASVGRIPPAAFERSITEGQVEALTPA